MPIKLTADLSKFKAELDLIARQGPGASREAVKVMGRDFIQEVEMISPRDTNRYVRGWLEAGTAAGVGNFPAPPVVPSRVGEKLKAFFLAQFEKWDYIVRRNERSGRSDKWTRKAIKLRDRAAEELAKYTETAIAVGVRVVDGRAFSVGRGRNLATVRTKVYGGTGSITRNGHETIVLLHNLEAHASIVEYLYRIRARAGARARVFGVKSVSRKYFNEVVKGTEQKKAA